VRSRRRPVSPPTGSAESPPKKWAADHSAAWCNSGREAERLCPHVE
jgi:hypothetical protein